MAPPRTSYKAHAKIIVPFSRAVGMVFMMASFAVSMGTGFGATTSGSAAHSTPMPRATPTPAKTPSPAPTPPPSATPSPVTVNVLPNETSWWTTLLAALGGGALTAAITWVVASRAFWQRANEEEIKLLQTSLDEFYGPFMRLLDVIFIMSQDLRTRLNDPNYRMLLYLTDKNWLPSLSTGDRAIVEEVVANDALLETLILSKSGGRVDDDVADYLSHTVAHIRMLKRAMAGRLRPEDHDMLVPYVFPKHLREVMRLQRDWIQQRIATLKGALHKAAPRYSPLVLAKNLKAPKWQDPDRPDAPSPRPTSQIDATMPHQSEDGTTPTT